MATKLTVLQRHIAAWKDCKRCSLHEGRQQVVFARGKVPAEILFVGEAPGESEDCLGEPFVGPAGHLLNWIIRESGADKLRYAVYNIVGCIPRDEAGDKVHEPEVESVKACSPRLQEFAKIADGKYHGYVKHANAPPEGTLKLVVAVGLVAKHWLEPGFKHTVKLHRSIPFIDIIHPAAILRANVAQQSLMTRRAVIALKTALREIEGGTHA